MTEEDIATVLSVTVPRVAEMRRANELLSVWVHEHQEYLFPPFQLHDERPDPKMPQLLSLLSDTSRSGWGWIEWFVSCRTLLMGRRPADLMQEGRFHEVLAAAQEEASRHRNAHW